MLVEAHRRITEYLNRFCDAVSYQGSSMLCRLLSFSSNSPSLLSLPDALNVFQDASSLINHTPKFSEYGEILAHLFRSLQSYRVGNLVEAYLAFEKFANAFVQGFRNWEPAWALEALYVVCYEVRILAEKADKELTFNGRSSEKLKAAGSLLMKVFGVLAGKGPKRVGALYVTCQLFKTYFKVKLMITSLEVGTVNLCRSVIRSIETARIFDFEEFPRRTRSCTSSLQSVTYMYYTGRLEVFNENFPAADTKLSYALQHCNPKRERNIRMILKYFKPLKLSIGIIPKDELVQNIIFLSVQYMNVVQALRKGDLRILRMLFKNTKIVSIVEEETFDLGNSGRGHSGWWSRLKIQQQEVHKRTDSTLVRAPAHIIRRQRARESTMGMCSSLLCYIVRSSYYYFLSVRSSY
ncbi:hypothetical protein Bca52824_016690 [Brassica carinata]|uniref:PCI domain-containing protein n=1 Tax=Brassica carinata TaxID=52824 RepID=A0A8X7W5J1_BRACI|nr:hypothetical protein Bca52824_016690 [Brassica carinata]